jgi:hypothetical protein
MISDKTFNPAPVLLIKHLAMRAIGDRIKLSINKLRLTVIHEAVLHSDICNVRIARKFGWQHAALTFLFDALPEH